MSRVRLTIPRPIHTVVTYGNDDQRGFFCTVVRGKEKIAEYDRVTVGYDGLEGLLRVLIAAGILTAEGVATAFDWLPVVDDICNIPTDEGQVAAAIIDNLRVGE